MVCTNHLLLESSDTIIDESGILFVHLATLHDHPTSLWNLIYICHHRLLKPNNHPILIPTPPTEDERPLLELDSKPEKKKILVNY
jgi:hypothetical protein